MLLPHPLHKAPSGLLQARLSSLSQPASCPSYLCTKWEELNTSTPITNNKTSTKMSSLNILCAVCVCVCSDSSEADMEADMILQQILSVLAKRTWFSIPPLNSFYLRRLAYSLHWDTHIPKHLLLTLDRTFTFIAARCENFPAICFTHLPLLCRRRHSKGHPWSKCLHLSSTLMLVPHLQYFHCQRATIGVLSLSNMPITYLLQYQPTYFK